MIGIQKSIREFISHTIINKLSICIFISVFTLENGNTQEVISESKSSPFETFFLPRDTFDKARFTTGLTFTALTYTGFSIGLYKTWYKNFDREPFHLFNDWGEWRHMDKMGHIYSAYFQSQLCYNGARWTGLNKKQSLWVGVAYSTLFQTTIEVMDGFVSKWGFSISDIGANIAGTTIFALQQQFWDEQRINIKISSVPKSYPEYSIISTDGMSNTTLDERATQLYGSNFFERYLKDYNAQIYWASIRVSSFLPEGNRWPKWLNVALGYGANNMFGGYDNVWSNNTHTFILNSHEYPRYSQFFIGLDVDLPQLNLNSPFLKTVGSVFNIFKIPSPALEINSLGQLTFHLLR